jgi:hypothetical protein
VRHLLGVNNPRVRQLERRDPTAIRANRILENHSSKSHSPPP